MGVNISLKTRWTQNQEGLVSQKKTQGIIKMGKGV